MPGPLAWPPPSAPERDVKVYLMLCGIVATLVGGAGVLILLFGHTT